MDPTDIFALPQDSERAAALTDALGADGFTVRLTLHPSPSPAGCAIFCWSAAAAEDEGFVDVAEAAAATDRAIGALLESGVTPPVAMPCYDYPAHSPLLARTLGNIYLSDIGAAIRAKQQNTSPPVPTARSRLFRRRMWTLAVGAASALGLVIGLEQGLASHLWPRFNERAAWSKLVESDPGCAELRQFVDRFPDGLHADEARLALAAPETVERTVNRDYPLHLFGPVQVGEGYASREHALGAAREWIDVDAGRQCRRIAAVQQADSAAAHVRELSEDCERTSGRYFCSLEGEGVCRIPVPVAVSECKLPRFE
jgi:hypothetical protein